jgi:hypothetical protein
MKQPPDRGCFFICAPVVRKSNIFLFYSHFIYAHWLPAK